MNEKIKVSVIVLAYNRENFITNALDSIVKQKVDFPFEVVVGEDCSTDNTARICMEYQEKYPDIVKVTRNKENLGLLDNFVSAYNRCKGEYIAICDADDFWINKHKLQIQADFLDQNKEYSACFHRALNYYQDDGSKSISNGLHQKKRNTVLDIINSNPVTFSTSMFRRGLFGEFPSWFNQVKSNDFAVNVLNAEHGDFYFMNKIMTVYRRHRESVWGMSTFEKQALISVLSRQILIEHYRGRNKDIYNKLVATYTNGCIRLAQHYQSVGNTEKLHEMEELVLKANPSFTIEQVKEMEEVRRKTAKERITQQIFRLVKATRREISKLIPLPKI